MLRGTGGLNENARYENDRRKWPKTARREIARHETVDDKSRVVARKPRDAAYFCPHPLTLRLLFTVHTLNSRSLVVPYRITTMHKSRCECETINYNTMPGVIYQNPCSGQNFGWSLWSRSMMSGSEKSQQPSHEITFSCQVFQPMRPRYLNVTERRTDSQTDRRLAASIPRCT